MSHAADCRKASCDTLVARLSEVLKISTIISSKARESLVALRTESVLRFSSHVWSFVELRFLMSTRMELSCKAGLSFVPLETIPREDSRSREGRQPRLELSPFCQDEDSATYHSSPRISGFSADTIPRDHEILGTTLIRGRPPQDLRDMGGHPLRSFVGAPNQVQGFIPRTRREGGQ